MALPATKSWSSNRVHGERPLDSRKRTLLHRAPARIEGGLHDARAELAHPVDLGLGRGLDGDDGARDAEAARREGDALPCVAGADRPDTATPRLGREHRHGVRGAAKLERVDGLEVLELEPHLGRLPVVAELHERRSKDDAFDALPGGVDVVETDGPNGRKLSHFAESFLPPSALLVALLSSTKSSYVLFLTDLCRDLEERMLFVLGNPLQLEHEFLQVKEPPLEEEHRMLYLKEIILYVEQYFALHKGRPPPLRCPLRRPACSTPPWSSRTPRASASSPSGTTLSAASSRRRPRRGRIRPTRITTTCA